MTDNPTPPGASTPPAAGESSPRTRLFNRYPELPYVLPLVVFWIGTFCEPKPQAAVLKDAAAVSNSTLVDGRADSQIQPAPGADSTEAGWLPYRYYPAVYSIKIALLAAAVAFCWPAYRPIRLPQAPLGIGVGLAGAAIWIGLVELGLEQRILAPLGLEWVLGLGQRSAFNPLAELAGSPLAAYSFLAVRFTGLVLLVPIMEEFFLRGFLMRFVMHPNWTQIPIGRITPLAVATGTLVPMLMHPSELFAAAAWFSAVTWLLVRSGSVWTCVLAHAITNLLMGLYVLASGHWYMM